MDSPPTSNLSFWSLSGEQLQAPREWEPALIELACPVEALESLEVTLQGERLEPFVQVLNGRSRTLVSWERANPGHYSIAVTCGGRTHRTSITVQPRKISTEAFKLLLNDLEVALPAQIAIKLKRAGGLSGVNVLPPEASTLASEMLRLRRAIKGTSNRPGLEKCLSVLAQAPHRVLVKREEFSRRDRVRRPSPTRLAESMRGSNLDESGRPLRLFDKRFEHSFDVYENRLLAAFCRQVQFRLRRLQRLLHSSVLDEANHLADALAKARRKASFLDEVSLPAHLPEQATMVLTRVPAYRAFFERYLEFNRSVAVRFEHPTLDAPLQNLPFLYQKWLTLKVVNALLDFDLRYGFEVHSQKLFHRVSGDAFITLLPGGKTILELRQPREGMTISLTPERSFTKNGNIRTVSYTQRPDISIEIKRGDGRSELLLFDPKYKLDGEDLSSDSDTDLLEEVANFAGSPKKVDIDKMHAYRDAIRNERDEHVVQYAAILYPGPQVAFGRGLEAIQAVPGLDGELHDRLEEVLKEQIIPALQANLV